MALSICYWANYLLTKEKLQQKSESDAQNQLLSLINRSQGKVNTRDFGALFLASNILEVSQNYYYNQRSRHLISAATYNYAAE